jgi:hypothetical protein
VKKLSNPKLVLGIQLRIISMTIQFDPQIKAGDMFTAASISLSAVAPLVFLAKDRANRVADQTNKASQDLKNG